MVNEDNTLVLQVISYYGSYSDSNDILSDEVIVKNGTDIREYLKDYGYIDEDEEEDEEELLQGDWGDLLQGRECEVIYEVFGDWDDPTIQTFRLTTLNKLKQEALKEYEKRLKDLKELSFYKE